LWTKNICQFLSNSLVPASKIILSEYLLIVVDMSCLQKGGVFNIEILLKFDNAIFKLLGIGVADIDKTSIEYFSFLIFSLSSTQNLCSSSTTINHKFL
jgi:hypothetical protein